MNLSGLTDSQRANHGRRPHMEQQETRQRLYMQQETRQRPHMQ